MRTHRNTSRRYPRGNDLIHICQTYGLAALHDHSFPAPGVIRFWATGYGGVWAGKTTEFEAEYRRGGGIRITQVNLA